MKWLCAALIILSHNAAAQESLVTGVSRDDVQITADFTGSDILVYGAVRRDGPAPQSVPMDVIVTLEGPSTAVTVRRKERRFGIWINSAAADLGDVPSYFAMAATGPIEDILTPADDERFDISLSRRISVTKITADSMNFPEFVEALRRIRAQNGAFQSVPTGVKLAEDTLFRADFALPSNVTEGDFRVRLFLLRGGKVIDQKEQIIDVRKTGIERQLTNLAHQRPFIYGVISLVMAAVAGWAASEMFRFLRR